jgi:N-acetyl-anhydromuramyl-L-alanine amidase AmpD
MPTTTFDAAHPDCLRDRRGAKIDAIVIHTMEGTLKGTVAWFKMSKYARARGAKTARLRVSLGRAPTDEEREPTAAEIEAIVPTAAHYCIGSDGSVVQMVPDDRAAIHAGNNTYNRRSIGFEHEGYADKGGFSDAMLDASARCVAVLCRKYGIPMDREHIIGHSEVPRATHHDPGVHWDWGDYMRRVSTHATHEPE